MNKISQSQRFPTLSVVNNSRKFNKAPTADIWADSVLGKWIREWIPLPGISHWNIKQKGKFKVLYLQLYRYFWRMWIGDDELFTSILLSPVLYILSRPGLMTSGGPSSPEAGERGSHSLLLISSIPWCRASVVAGAPFSLRGCSGYLMWSLRMFKAKEQLNGCSANELAFQRPVLRRALPKWAARWKQTSLLIQSCLGNKIFLWKWLSLCRKTTDLILKVFALSVLMEFFLEWTLHHFINKQIKWSMIVAWAFIWVTFTRNISFFSISFCYIEKSWRITVVYSWLDCCIFVGLYMFYNFSLKKYGIVERH